MYVLMFIGIKSVCNLLYTGVLFGCWRYLWTDNHIIQFTDNTW